MTVAPDAGPDVTEAGTRPWSLVGSHVAQVVSGLQTRYLAGYGTRRDPSAAADLARLRRADATSLGRSVDVLDIVLGRFPASLQTDAEEPTRAERAAHTAICLFAVHMQSRNRPMHVAQQSLGDAARELARRRSGDGSLDPATLRRFHSVATATGPGQRTHFLRAFITLLRSEEIPLDYARLARDLYFLDDSTRAASVRLRWGRDLHRHTDKASSVPNPTMNA